VPRLARSGPSDLGVARGYPMATHCYTRVVDGQTPNSPTRTAPAPDEEGVEQTAGIREKREALKKGLDEVDRVTAAGRWRSPR